MGKLNLTEQILSLLINDVEVQDLQVITDAFNASFLIITENLNLQEEISGDAISFLKDIS
jgi:hypothetical protein